MMDMSKLSMTMINSTVATMKKNQLATIVSGLKVDVSNCPRRSWKVKEAESR